MGETMGAEGEIYSLFPPCCRAPFSTEFSSSVYFRHLSKASLELCLNLPIMKVCLPGNTMQFLFLISMCGGVTEHKKKKLTTMGLDLHKGPNHYCLFIFLFAVSVQ